MIISIGVCYGQMSSSRQEGQETRPYSWEGLGVSGPLPEMLVRLVKTISVLINTLLIFLYFL